MNVKLVYMGMFENEFNGQKYKVYRFVDINSLSIIYGTNLNKELEEGKIYQCLLAIKRNKLVVQEIL